MIISIYFVKKIQEFRDTQISIKAAIQNFYTLNKYTNFVHAILNSYMHNYKHFKNLFNRDN